MDPSSPSGCTDGMSNVRHPSLSDVLLFETERAIAETSLTEDDLAIEVMQAYEDQTPEHARKLDVKAPRLDQDHRTFAKRATAANTRLRRYRTGGQPVPLDMLEPWLSCLPRLYRERADRTLIRRRGYIGAQRPTEQGAATDCSMLPNLCKEYGEAIAAIGQGLADGRIDAADLERAPSMIQELDDLIAAATSARAAVVERTGYSEAVVSVIKGRSA